MLLFGAYSMLKNTFDRKCISANSSLNPNPKAHCFRTDEITSFFQQMYGYLSFGKIRVHLQTKRKLNTDKNCNFYYVYLPAPQ